MREGFGDSSGKSSDLSFSELYLLFIFSLYEVGLKLIAESFLGVLLETSDIYIWEGGKSSISSLETYLKEILKQGNFAQHQMKINKNSYVFWLIIRHSGNTYRQN